MSKASILSSILPTEHPQHLMSPKIYNTEFSCFFLNFFYHNDSVKVKATFCPNEFLLH